MDPPAATTASSSSERVRELEATVARLRAEKEAAERAAAALRAELESEQGAAETATSEVMLMIGRLQREKAAATIEARAFRRVAETRAGRVRELQDQLAGAGALAASYHALLRARGVDPDEDDRCDHHRDEAGCAVDKEPSPSPPPPAAEEEFEDKHAVDVRNPVAEEPVADDAGLCARVEALEADSAAVRREVAALRAEALPRRPCSRDQKQRFSVLAVVKWFFSTISWGVKRSASAARKLPSISSSSSSTTTTTYLLLALLPLLNRSKGALRIHSKTSRRQPAHSPHGLEYLMLCYSS